MGELGDGLLAADDGVVRAALDQELTRLRAAGPWAALGVAPDSSAEEVRARFLALTKIYHPNRFARRPADLVKLANEVFLHLRRAYERAGERPASGERAAATSAAPPATGDRAAATSPAAGGAARAGEVSSPSQPKLDVEAALARRRRARPHSTASATSQGRPGSTPPPAAVEAPDRKPRRDGEKERFDSALAEVRHGRLPSARATLRELVAESPSDRQYRAYLHFVTGRMHDAAGRAAEAAVEYDRALGFDPDLEAVRKARENLTGIPARGAGPTNRRFRK